MECMPPQLFGAMVPPAGKNPFGAGLREGAGAAGGITGIISTLQSLFSAQIIAGLKDFARSSEAVWGVLGISFIYGVVHAAGPGHGKAVIAAYVLASRSALKRGIAMAMAAALLQALVAIALVGVFSIMLNATAASLSSMAGQIERISFAAVALVGTWLLWRKAGRLAGLTGSQTIQDSQDHHNDHHHDENCGCGHSHAPVVPQEAGLRDMAMAVVAAGIRPCSGAILVLVFALAQGLFGVGIAAALVMALGTALTTSALACLSVLARHTASRLTGGADSLTGQRVITGLEVLAAAFVAWLGAAFLIAAP
ncbi:MAG: nickel transporter [Rhizobiales bacterium]|nr:nickel transporter [Hyphomicrobiales bacterium]